MMFKKKFLMLIILTLILSLSEIVPVSAGTNTGFNPNGYYSFINRATGKYLDNLGTTADGANIAQSSAGESNNQQWQIIQSDTGYYRIICRTGGKALDNMGLTADGDNISQYSLGSSTNQQWQIVSQGNGYYKIINRTSSKCLDTGGLTADGSIVQQWGSGSSNNQQWQIILKFTSANNNPVLWGSYADPEIRYFNGTYYIYPTTDGFPNWSGTVFKCFSSTDLINWIDHGVILDLANVSWSHTNAWAPTVIQRGSYYYMYFCAGSKFGVARAASPTGPFTDIRGSALASTIDPGVFIDDDGQGYLYYGNGTCYVVKLNSDMISFNGTPVNITPKNFREGSFVVKRNGKYYLFYSVNDTRDPTYCVYAASGNSPMGPFTAQANNPILQQNPGQGIYATGHNSVLQITGKDEWYICYHRFIIPGGDGMHREVCLDKLNFNSDGTVAAITPTRAGVSGLSPYSAYLLTYFSNSNSQIYYAVSSDGLHWTPVNNGNPVITSSIGTKNIRDPFTFRDKNGKYHAMGTNNWSSTSIVMYDSNDLITWTNQRLVNLPVAGATFAWAPECMFDPSVNAYRIYFAANPNNAEHKMYSTTTTDFNTFTTPSAFYDPGAGNYAIDGTILPNNNNYYMFFKYSDPGPTGKGIQRVQSGSIAGPWNARSAPLTGNDEEGPTVFQINGQNLWYMYTDAYKAGYWNCYSTTNLAGGWTQLSASAFSIPSGARHGNVMPITAEEYNRLVGNVTRSAFSQIEAESFDSQSGVQTETCSEGGLNVSYIENGDYITFKNIDFESGAGSFQARIASGTNGCNIEIRMDSVNGTLIGTCPVAGTGDWQVWTTVNCNVSSVSGKHDLYFVFTGGSGYLINFNWFKFILGSTPTPTPSGIKGDVNGDGKVDIIDALMIAQYCVGTNPAGFILSNADVNCDGAIDIIDALLIAQYVVGLLTKLGCS